VNFDEERLIEFFLKPQTSVIEFPEDKKDIVFKHAERGIVYTSKQTSAGDIYKFENDNLYISWQVKSGKSKPFGPAKWCDEVSKAILHKCDDHITFVLVIVAQSRGTFFNEENLKKGEYENIEFINDGNECLAVQFNPGFIMHVDRKSRVSTPKKKNQTSQKGKTSRRNSPKGNTKKGS